MTKQNQVTTRKSNSAPFIIAIITSITTILAPIITLWYQNKLQTKDLIEISADRGVALKGYWKGYNFQPFGKDTISIPLKMNLVIEAKVLKGSIEVDKADLKESDKHFNINGGFYDNRFLKIDYYNANAGIVQFGIYILELSPDSRKLKGKFIGYGSKSEKIITGDIFYEKID